MKEELKLERKMKKKLKKKEFEKFFYNHYFQEISETESIPIEFFYHPKNSSSSKNSKNKNAPKTINQSYIAHISKSPVFINKFQTYMNKWLIRDYKELIDSKFDGLIRKWEEEAKEADNFQKAYEKIQGYILWNKKCKLPWSLQEI